MISAGCVRGRSPAIEGRVTDHSGIPIVRATVVSAAEDAPVASPDRSASFGYAMLFHPGTAEIGGAVPYRSAWTAM